MPQQQSPKVRASLACKIVNLERTKLNDAIAKGYYRCAPSTDQGAARFFDLSTLLPLYFFARLMDYGISVPRAGELACEMAERLKSAEKSKKSISSLTVLFGERSHAIPFGSDKPHPDLVRWLPTSEFNPDRIDDLVGVPVMHLTFEVKNVREIISFFLDREFARRE